MAALYTNDNLLVYDFRNNDLADTRNDFVLPKKYAMDEVAFAPAPLTESGLTIRKSTKDERAVCGKRPVYIGVCTCTKSDCNCKIGKDCCNKKKQVKAQQAAWDKCIADVRAYNLQVAKDNAALPPEDAGTGGGGSATEDAGSSGSGTGGGGVKPKPAPAQSPTDTASASPGSSAPSTGMSDKNKLLIFGAVVLVALILVIALFAGRKPSTTT